VFEIAKTVDGYASTPTSLISFTDSANGTGPNGALITDAAGDLFGTVGGGNFTTNGATTGYVFEIAKTAGGYASTPTILATFNGTDSANPGGPLIADAAGDLIGTAGGGVGTIFEIVKTTNGYASTPVTLVDFPSTDGEEPDGEDLTGGLIADAAGNLFGTAGYGPYTGAGTVFEIAKTASGYASAPTTLASFDYSNGGYPNGSLLADAAGDLFGTAGYGPSAGAGAVFEVTGSGYQVACYRSGTRIATPTGALPIEQLRAGDVVRNIHGVCQPIRWIGSRHIDCRRHPEPHRVWPVRVRAHAFAEKVPQRDLWLSPDHAVFVDDVLIPIKHLINDRSIAQVPVDAVTYYHVELSAHDVLLAEGLPAESYLDTGDRANFSNGGEVTRLFADFAAPGLDPAFVRDARSYAPLVVHGPELEAARRIVGARISPSVSAAA
jgi:hypothetical protein